MLLQRRSYALLHESVTQNSDNKEESRRGIDLFFVTHSSNIVCNFLVRRMNQNIHCSLLPVNRHDLTTVSRKFIVAFSMIRLKDRKNFATYRTIKFSILRFNFSLGSEDQRMDVNRKTHTNTHDQKNKTVRAYRSLYYCELIRTDRLSRENPPFLPLFKRAFFV